MDIITQLGIILPQQTGLQEHTFKVNGATVTFKESPLASGIEGTRYYRYFAELYAEEIASQEPCERYNCWASFYKDDVEKYQLDKKWLEAPKMRFYDIEVDGQVIGLISQCAINTEKNYTAFVVTDSFFTLSAWVGHHREWHTVKAKIARARVFSAVAGALLEFAYKTDCEFFVAYSLGAKIRDSLLLLGLSGYDSEFFKNSKLDFGQYKKVLAYRF